MFQLQYNRFLFKPKPMNQLTILHTHSTILSNLDRIRHKLKHLLMEEVPMHSKVLKFHLLLLLDKVTMTLIIGVGATNAQN